MTHGGTPQTVGKRLMIASMRTDERDDGAHQGGPVPFSGEQVQQAVSRIAGDPHATLGWGLDRARAEALRE
jgi:hypothetical protein